MKTIDSHGIQSMAHDARRKATVISDHALRLGEIAIGLDGGDIGQEAAYVAVQDSVRRANDGWCEIDAARKELAK